jgi:Ca2+-dependent lipid-binding protein
MDWDFSSADDTIGHACISLASIAQQSEYTFEQEFFKGGVPRGWVKGKARLEWPKVS